MMTVLVGWSKIKYSFIEGLSAYVFDVRMLSNESPSKSVIPPRKTPDAF